MLSFLNHSGGEDTHLDVHTDDSDVTFRGIDARGLLLDVLARCPGKGVGLSACILNAASSFTLTLKESVDPSIYMHFP